MPNGVVPDLSDTSDALTPDPCPLNSELLPLNVRTHRISNVDIDPSSVHLPDADLDALRSDPEISEHNYSFTTLRPHGSRLYLGTTNMRNRILWCFDPENGTFEDLEYSRIGGEYDIKIHRSLEHDPRDDVFYGVSSGLHNEDVYHEAPGAPIFRFDPRTKTIESLGIPLEHEYTQTIQFDPRRRLLYGFTYHTFSFYVFDVDERKTIFHALPGSIAHLSAIDDDGCIWSTWCRDRHFIFKYDPSINKIVWTRKRFPEGGNSYMYPGAGPIDCMLNGGDGYLYVALETGSLVRLDPKTVACEYLGRPSPYPRMPALILGTDGLFYGTCGDDWNVYIYTYDRRTNSFSVLRKLECEGVSCYRPHDIAIVGSSIFVGETDNPKRSGYLWEVQQ